MREAEQSATPQKNCQGPSASQPLVFFAFFPPATTPACLLLLGCVSARPSRFSRGATRYAGRPLLFLMSSSCSYGKQISRQFCAQLLRHRHLRQMLSSSHSCGKYAVPFCLRKIHAPFYVVPLSAPLTSALSCSLPRRGVPATQPPRTGGGVSCLGFFRARCQGSPGIVGIGG